VKDADEIGLLTEAAKAADASSRGSPPAVSSGRTEADVAREVREQLIAEATRRPQFAIVGSGPKLGLAPPRGLGPRHRRGRADRPRHRRDDRWLRFGHHADAVGDRRRPWKGPSTSGSATCSACCRAPRPQPPSRFGGHHPGRRRCRRSRPDRGCRYGEAFFHRTGHGNRARGSRGSLHHRRQPGATSRGDGILDRARDLRRGQVRRADRGHRRVRPAMVRSRSTRRRATCTWSTVHLRTPRAIWSRGRPRRPPATLPSTKRDSSDARLEAAAATSSGSPSSPVSWRFLRISIPATGSS